jgi:hypothetical protein
MSYIVSKAFEVEPTIRKMAHCKHCDSEIAWDENIVSKSGKMIPLDVGTGERHSCEEGLQAWKESRPRQLHTCMYCKESKIYFDSDFMT